MQKYFLIPSVCLALSLGGTLSAQVTTPPAARPTRTEADARASADRFRAQRDSQFKRTGQRPELISNYQKAVVLAVPESMGLNPFYRKYVDAMGIPVVSSERVPDDALLVARDIVNSMLATRPDVRKALIDRKWRTGVIGETEMTMDIPEYGNFRRPGKPEGEPINQLDRDYHANRSRGMGGNPTTGAEENLLGYPGTRYWGEHIFVHEFAHAMMTGLRIADSTLAAQIRVAYDSAMAAGKYLHPDGRKHYATTNAGEYWAEGVQWWFFSNYGECFKGNIKVETPEEFAAYDPMLNSIISKVYATHRIPMDVFHAKRIRPVTCPAPGEARANGFTAGGPSESEASASEPVGAVGPSASESSSNERFLNAGASPQAMHDSLAVRSAVAPSNAIWLDTLDLTTWQQRRQRPRAKLSLRGRPITMNSVVYPHGVGTLTINEFLVNVHGEAEKFVAMVGIDDEMKTGRGTVNFEVWADDKLVASSGVIRAGQPPKLLVANLKGARIVQLITDDGQDTSNDDNADWGGAMFVMNAGSTAKPEPYVLPADTPAIISMTTKAEPSINGPRITGATPGRPFLFRVPATGDGPLTFAARNLPAGVTLDANTGIISGSLVRDGTTVVDLTVTGPKGKATRQLTIVGGKDKLALTPPMGWNSWNAWGTGVDAEKVRNSTIAMETSGLAGHGYQYIAIDDGWEGTRTPDGELPAIAAKFPDMKALGDFIHSKGLKFGIYSSPGPRTCGGREGSYQHELQDARTWAKWGVDLLKHDYCSYEQVKPGFDWPTLQAPYVVMRHALDSLDRDMVYSIGNYGYGEAWKWAGDIGGELWRTTGDLTDSWSNLESVGFRQAGREKYAGPGRWNDTDMLVVGNVGLGPALHPTKLTQNEQVLHLTLWAMQAAPLLIGADMSQLDAFTIALLTNDEVLDVDQDVLGRAGGRVWKNEKLEVWSRPLSDGTTAVALFNRGMKPVEVTARWSDIGVTGRQPVRNLWLRKDLGMFSGSFKSEVPRHGAVMLKIGTPKPTR